MLVMIAYKKFTNVTIMGILTKSRHYKKTFLTSFGNVGPHNIIVGCWELSLIMNLHVQFGQNNKMLCHKLPKVLLTTLLNLYLISNKL